MAEKRKTHTSTDVKRRYNEKVYSQVSFSAPKDMVAQFKELCKANNISQAQILKQAMQNYIDNNA